jgi:hypothetical protein
VTFCGAPRGRCSLQDRDQYTTEVVKAGLNEYRGRLTHLIHNQVDRYAAAINLPSVSPQFEQDLVDALLWCHLMHLEATNRKRGNTRKVLLCIANESAAAERHLARLRNALNELTPRIQELLEQQLEGVAKVAVSLVSKQQPWFNALGSVADLTDSLAKGLKGTDKGGAPKMLAFNALVKVLAHAFERAKNRPAKVTRNNYTGQFSGEFMSLVEAVLPLAIRWAGTPERPMHYPKSPEARGKYIYESTRRGAGKKRPA